MNEKEIFISIIIPCFNPNINNLNNILNRLKKLTVEYEVIIVNDGSTFDFLNEIEYCEKVSYFSQSNQGVSIARNQGLRIANGKYIFFMDSDDDCPEEFIRYINNHYNSLCADWIIFNVFEKDVTNNRERIRKIRVDKYTENAIDPFIYLLITTKFLNECWGKLISNRLIKENQIEFPNGVLVGEDLRFNLRVLQHANSVEAIPICSYLYIYEGKNMDRIYRQPIIRFDDIYNRANEMKQLINERCSFKNISTYTVLYNSRLIKMIWNDCVNIAGCDIKQEEKKYINTIIKKICINNEISLKNFNGIFEKIQYFMVINSNWTIWKFMFHIKKCIRKGNRIYGWKNNNK